MYILFDIGGTKMRFAVTRDLQEIEPPIVTPTPKSFDIAMTDIEKIIKDLAGNEKIDGISGGLSGVLNREDGTIFNAPHLSNWNGKSVIKSLQKLTTGKVSIENDAAIVGLGEAVRGAGKDHSIVAYITVSTGVGGARIVGNKIDHSIFGFEPGHQIIDADGTLDSENTVGTLEGYVSGSALQKRTGKLPRDNDDPHVWEELSKQLAYGLYNTILHWSPDILVLGGSMITGKPAISVDLVEKYLSELMTVFPKLPKIKKATLGDLGGLYGAMEYQKSIAN